MRPADVALPLGWLVWHHASTLDVLHVIHQFPPESNGGSESYVHDLAQLQRRAGLDAQVFAGSMAWQPTIGLDHFEVDGIPVHRIHRDDSYFDHHVKAWHPGIAAAFGAFLDEHRPSVVHLHQWLRLSNDLVATAHARGIPTVVQLHDMYTSCPRAFRMRKDDPACSRPLGGASCWDCVPRYGHETRAELQEGVDLFAASLRRELALAHTVLVAVPTIADLIAKGAGMPRERYRTLPLGYRPRFPGAPKLPGPQPGEAFRFACWGSIGRHKGVHVALQALRIVVGHGAKAELHLLGGISHPDYEAELKSLAEGLPVTFHGPFTPDQLRAVAPHAGVFPSMCLETYGFVLDECFELGLPAITSDIGALAYRAGAGGIAAKAGDAGLLADAMLRLMTEPGLRDRLCAHLPALSPSMAAHSSAIAAIYEEARTTPPPPPCAPEVPLARRIRFLMTQRDNALGHLFPKDGLC